MIPLYLCHSCQNASSSGPPKLNLEMEALSRGVSTRAIPDHDAEYYPHENTALRPPQAEVRAKETRDRSLPARRHHRHKSRATLTGLLD